MGVSSVNLNTARVYYSAGMAKQPRGDAIGRYQRRVAASEARVWENVLDFEHLPWLHRHAFSDLERLAASRTGWRVKIGTPGESAGARLDLELETFRSEACYVARTLAGPGAGTEIWTTVRPASDRETDVDVTFHVPGIPESAREAVGLGFVKLYTQLWDEDESMMRRRQAVLDGSLLGTAPAPGPRLSLGPEEELRRGVPRVVDAGGVPLRIVERDGELFAHAFVCPHLGGPLQEDAEEGCVRCTWHGYRFDPTTGAGIGGHALALPFVARIEVDQRTGEASLPLGPVSSAP
jgi:nitrite reductase/ring-hydroxylating ferredoxin subunit